MKLHKFNKLNAKRILHFKNNRNMYFKVFSLILIIIIIILCIIYLTYAKFSVNNNFNAFNTKVGKFNNDYIIASYVDGTLSTTIPKKDTGYIVEKITCTNSATAVWNYNSWDITIHGGTSSETKCKVYFVSKSIYSDSTGASIPELYQGLIPVKYDASGNTIVADTSSEWYNYASHNWANAVLVNCSDSTIKSKYFDDNMNLKSSVVGSTIAESEILQYYVWIPRYQYLLWNAENGSSDPQAINIMFENATSTKYNGTKNGTWLTHPAFTFGDTELNGIWVGKFETSGSISNLTIKPNVRSLTNLTVGGMFNAARNQELTYASNYGIDANEVDTHMMKNMEWGAVAYLSSSIYGRYSNSTTCISSGCEVWINPNSNYTIGCAGDSVSAAKTTACNAWNTSTGVNASTTGNMYGIYDMSGGSWEYVMGNMVDSSGNFYPSGSGLTKPDVKYYNSYVYQSDASIYTDHARGGIGDATKETLKTFGSVTGGWYSDYAFLPSGSFAWFLRGGSSGDGVNAGVFRFHRNAGGTENNYGFRSVLSA